MIPLQDVPSASALSGCGYVLVESDQQEELLDGAFFLSGEIPRKSFERGIANHVRLTPSGDWEPDPLVLDERFMVAHIRGKGLAIFTGCSHAGIVNICSHARDLFPDTPLYALVGGLHLVYPNEDLIDPTIAELTIAGSFLAEGLVDEFVGYVRAAVLGAGRPLLDLPGRRHDRRPAHVPACRGGRRGRGRAGPDDGRRRRAGTG